MSKYEALDAAIVRVIRVGGNRLSAIIHRPSVRDAAKPFETRLTGVERIVDRRLQAMRKAGAVTFTNAGGWMPLPPPPTAATSGASPAQAD